MCNMSRVRHVSRPHVKSQETESFTYTLPVTAGSESVDSCFRLLWVGGEIVTPRGELLPWKHDLKGEFVIAWPQGRAY